MRKIMYIEIGNLPKSKAEVYVKEVMHCIDLMLDEEHIRKEVI